jgi:hypothetical protein
MLTLPTFMLLTTLSAQPSLGVMDLELEGGTAREVGTAASSIITQELERLQLFRITSAETTRVMLGVERQRQLLGCDTCSGSSLSDAIELDFIVTGKIIKSKSDYTLTLALLPVGKATATSSARVTAPTEAKLLSEAGPTAVKLVGKMLEGKQGTALITSSELGASVKVDDTLVGTTPLSAPVKLAGGPHVVAVEKDGFTLSRRELRINPDQETEAHFTLVPSPDTIHAYEAKARSTRLLAWSSAAVAAVGLGVFALGQLEADGLYGSPATKGTFLYAQSQLTAGVESDASTNYRTQATGLKNSIFTWEIISVSALAVAGVAAVASVVLFVVGDPPERYDAFHASLSVTPTGFVFAGAF